MMQPDADVAAMACGSLYSHGYGGESRAITAEACDLDAGNIACGS
ncbi:MAG: hypothetical protein OEN02_09210 [Gammaproteobacteria bacterium]|nr:hypothetical protein [Gammaproteobacteria bacterium]